MGNPLVLIGASVVVTLVVVGALTIDQIIDFVAEVVDKVKEKF